MTVATVVAGAAVVAGVAVGRATVAAVVAGVSVARLTGTMVPTVVTGAAAVQVAGAAVVASFVVAGATVADLIVGDVVTGAATDGMAGIQSILTTSVDHRQQSTKIGQHSHHLRSSTLQQPPSISLLAETTTAVVDLIEELVAEDRAVVRDGTKWLLLLND
ncbi:hypothetical protein E3N88_02234 [Mikania micrantha]|uniref:Uncharacterized protein n=1 Tax=Mikania micrantha TaxID=192012 RepID=A0A5N6Q5G4_9ASTR|nr:hypothetical protein E3N88_02234 [Mikania micrantha]